MDIVCSQETCPSSPMDTDVLPQSVDSEILPEPIDLEPDNEETDENIQTQEDIEVEQILKGILLKPRQRIWDGKKKVNWDLKLRYIPWDEEKDYTIEIEIVKEIPKKVVSYREMYKKMAEEKAEADRKEALLALGELIDDADDGDDEDEEICQIQFGKLRVAAEPGKGGRIRSPAPSLDFVDDGVIKLNPGLVNPQEEVKAETSDSIESSTNNQLLEQPSISNILSSNVGNVFNTQEENNINSRTNVIPTNNEESSSVTQIIITGPDRSAPDQLESLETASIPHIMDAKMVPEVASFTRVEPRLRLASITEEPETARSDQSIIDQIDLTVIDDEIEEIESNFPIL